VYRQLFAGAQHLASLEKVLKAILGSHLEVPGFQKHNNPFHCSLYINLRVLVQIQVQSPLV
jgi:hypothetical protein